MILSVDQSLEQKVSLEYLEIELLLDGIKRHYGYDFSNYALPSLKRRITHQLATAGFKNVSDLLFRILHDELFFDGFLKDISITVTEMFRDPEFFSVVRGSVIPILKSMPFVKVWHAGCATGEEVYSMAILLKEEGLYDRVRLYATDFNNQSLAIAERGIYSVKELQQYTKNYNLTGGEGSFSDYYHARYQSAKFDNALKQNITFSNHNLVTDGVFGEIDLIICRNVLIYFNRQLQDRVFKLFSDSLSQNGFLCLGASEDVISSRYANRFKAVEEGSKIFRKVDAQNQTTYLLDSDDRQMSTLCS